MSRIKPRRYWLVYPNGSRQLIDPLEFNLDRLAELAPLNGARVVVEGAAAGSETPDGSTLTEAPQAVEAPARPPRKFEPPVSALGPLFRDRFKRVYTVLVDYEINFNTRPTTRVLGGYYKSRRLVRIYSHDTQTGRRPMEELFDTFLHELAHHIEYTEPDSYHARSCQRVPGRMHSPLFWRILGDLKARWIELQNNQV